MNSRTALKRTMFCFQRAFISLVCAGSLLGVQACSQKETKDHLFQQQTHAFLQHQRNEKTGIVNSFINTTDKALIDQASTYDLALAGLGYLQLNDIEGARGILTFFKQAWDPNYGLCNFYDTVSAGPGVETTIHLGPNMWVALLAVHYTVLTRDEAFYPLAKDIALWAAKLNRLKGGLSMGPHEDWGGNWPYVTSSENNIVAYSVFRALHAREENAKLREVFLSQMRGIEDYLRQVTIGKDAKGKLIHVSVGSNPFEDVSVVSASDVLTMMLLAFNRQELYSLFSLTANDLLEYARNHFFVSVDDTEGYDFTDQRSTDTIGRPRMISLEWSAQFAAALFFLEKSHNGLRDLKQQTHYRDQARGLLAALDKKKIHQKNFIFYPYATKNQVQVFPFAPWWKTPSGEKDKCGAISSSMWRLFAQCKFNPLDLR